MKKYNFREYNQEQSLMSVVVPYDLLEEDHPARIFDRVIESIDLTSIYDYYSNEGNPPYHPKMMLKVLLYSYRRGTKSCRLIFDGLTSGRADYFYLSAGQMPDFRTINDFRTRHINEIPDIFAQVVLLCEEIDMLGFEHLAIDGEKIQANASFKKSYNKERLEKRYNKIKKGIEKLIETEPNEYLSQKEKDKKIQKLEKEEVKLKNLSKELDEIRKTSGKDATINTTDKEAPVMTHKNGRKIPSYNHQSAVDDKYQITVAVNSKASTDAGNDLLLLIDKSKENTGKTFENVSSDSGFCDYDTLQEVIENRDENILLPDKRYEATINEDTAKGKYDGAKFERTENGGLVCPNGEELEVKQQINEDGHTKTVYTGKNCQACQNHDECTKAKNRTVTIDSREKYRDIMRDRLQSEKGRNIYKNRKWIVECPHGNDQKNMGWIQHHLRGLAKASLEFSLIRISSNIGKIAKYKSNEILAMACI